jgi:hypothetical protein
MSQHDFDIANQTASNARADINSALKALVSNSSGGSEPATKYANQFWYDTTNNILKLRNEANSAWLSVGYIDQTGGFRVLDNTQVVNTSGTQTGLLGDQSQATWESGTGTTESLVSPAKVKAAIDALVTPSPIKAWVNFNGTGTVSIRGSYNVASITDLGVGRYRVNFTDALEDTNYAIIASGGYSDLHTDRHAIPVYNTRTTTSFEIYSGSTASNTKIDFEDIYAVVYR